MNTENLAKRIYSDLNKKGAGLGDASIIFINKSIKDYLEDEKIHPAVKALEALPFHTGLILISKPGRGTITSLSESGKVGVILNGESKTLIDNLTKKTYSKPIVIDQLGYPAFSNISEIVKYIKSNPCKLVFIFNTEAVPFQLSDVCHIINLF